MFLGIQEIPIDGIKCHHVGTIQHTFEEKEINETRSTESNSLWRDSKTSWKNENHISVGKCYSKLELVFVGIPFPFRRLNRGNLKEFLV